MSTSEKALASLWQLNALVDRPPRTEEALHAYIKAILGFHIPRVAVCENHQAPFDFVKDVFFRNHERFLVLASRGSGKTRDLAITNLLASMFHRGVGTAHFGAIGAQSSWGFDYVKDMLRPAYLNKDITRLVAGSVRWKNGSWIMISTGRSITGVTALRAQRLIQDEIDLWDMEAHETAQLLVTGTKRYGSQRIAASTAYNAYGLMSTLWGVRHQRQYQSYRWCLWESLAPCRVCKGEQCPFYIWTNPRTGEMEPLCKGRALKSDGFIPLQAAIDEYYAVDAETFAVQKLLLSPERRSLIYPTWDPEVHLKKAPMGEIRAHASFGVGVDWGFDHPLVYTVFAQLPNGIYWAIEELGERFATPDRELELALGLNDKYKKEAGRSALTNEPTYDFPTFFPGVDQPKSIAAFAEAGLSICPNQVKLREDGHRAIRRLLDKNKGPLLYVDPDRCPMLAYQIGRLHRDEKGKEVIKDNDFPDSARYVLGTAAELGGLSPGGYLIV